MPARQLADAVHHLGAGGLGRREGLVGAHRPGRLVEDAEVGEGSSDVDAEAKTGVGLVHIRLSRLPSHKFWPGRTTGLSGRGADSSFRSYRAPLAWLHRTAFSGPALAAPGGIDALGPA